MIARHHRHMRLLCQRLGGILEAHGADGGGRRADKHDAAGSAGVRKIGVLRQEPVPRMNAGRTRRLGDRDDPVTQKVAFARGRRADVMRLVGKAHERRVGIGIGINGDAVHPETAGGAEHAQGDLAAVGDKDGGQA